MPERAQWTAADGRPYDCEQTIALDATVPAPRLRRRGGPEMPALHPSHKCGHVR
ncbi:hypothetical protein MCBG_01910 [Micromonospora sp. M42]|nr:hypothetical protein MCBG_01910 [Micromonospora sp. M42]